MTAAPPRLLVIDDDPREHAAVRRALTEARLVCDLVECDSAPAALRAADGGGFDGVLLKQDLPGATALALLSALRERLPHAAILVLADDGDDVAAVELMKAGASDYLAERRHDARMLAKALRQALALQAARAQAERAERGRYRYTAMLRGLVEAGPTLYQGDTVAARLGAAALVACQILGGSEAFVELRVGDAPVALCVRGGRSAALGDGDRRWWEEPPSPLVVRQPLLSMDGRAAGLLAVLHATPASELPDEDQLLLAQIAHMAGASLESLRLYDAARQAIESRDAVMAVVSHDLRSPLGALQLGIEVLRDGATAEVATILDRMERSAGHMNRLIADLLDVSRIDSRAFTVHAAAQPVQPIVDEAYELVQPLAAQAEVRLLVAAMPEVRVLAERHRVVQVLVNLLGNAIKFTPRAGSVELRVTATAGEVQLLVSDTGSGIEPAHLPHVFGRYWRKDGRGLGLGLFIAKAIVDAHGGRIWVDSQLGTGSTFAFTLLRA